MPIINSNLSLDFIELTKNKYRYHFELFHFTGIIQIFGKMDRGCERLKKEGWPLFVLFAPFCPFCFLIKNVSHKIHCGQQISNLNPQRISRTSPTRLVTRWRSRYSSNGMAYLRETPVRSLKVATSMRGPFSALNCSITARSDSSALR
jgi:hypothetical protein